MVRLTALPTEEPTQEPLRTVIDDPEDWRKPPPNKWWEPTLSVALALLVLAGVITLTSTLVWLVVNLSVASNYPFGTAVVASLYCWSLAGIVYVLISDHRGWGRR